MSVMHDRCERPFGRWSSGCLPYVRIASKSIRPTARRRRPRRRGRAGTRRPRPAPISSSAPSGIWTRRTAGHREAEMVELAGFAAGDRLDVGGPAPARLVDHPADDVVVHLDDLDAAVRESVERRSARRTGGAGGAWPKPYTPASDRSRTRASGPGGRPVAFGRCARAGERPLGRSRSRAPACQRREGEPAHDNTLHR